MLFLMCIILIALSRRIYATEAVATTESQKLEVFVNGMPVLVDPETTVLQVTPVQSKTL